MRSHPKLKPGVKVTKIGFGQQWTFIRSNKGMVATETTYHGNSFAEKYRNKTFVIKNRGRRSDEWYLESYDGEKFLIHETWLQQPEYWEFESLDYIKILKKTIGMK